MKIDKIVLVCKGCQGERLYYPNPVLTSAEAAKAWLDTVPGRCCCGAETCNAKLHLMKEDSNASE